MEKPGFYAILPSPVRYDRRLSASEKVFFAEITALSDQCGYCYAGNGYFSELYDTSDRTEIGRASCRERVSSPV